MGLGPTEIPLYVKSDLDHCLDLKKSGFFHLLIITCLGGGMHYQSALVFYLSFLHAELMSTYPFLLNSLTDIGTKWIGEWGGGQ